MASAQASAKLSQTIKVTQYDFDPGGVDPVDVAWVDMRDFATFMCIFFRTIGTGAVDTFAILANSQSNGGGTNVNVKTHAVASEPDAVGDYIFLECTAEELAALGTDLRYVSASVEFAVSTDEGVVTYIRGGPRFAERDLTAEVIA